MSKTKNKQVDAALLEALPSVIRPLAARGVLRRYRAGTTLIEEGERGDTVFVILEGAVRIFCADSSGKEITLATYGPGEYVGEMSLDGSTRSASVSTDSDCVCSIVSADKLRAYLAACPEFTLELIGKLIRRVRAATLSARSLALLDVYGRLARLLDTLAVNREDGTRIIEQKLTHLAMSKRIGCARELVSKILKDLETGGFILRINHQYVLLSKLPPNW